MRVIAQTNKEWLCAECKYFLYVIYRTDDELDLVCQNDENCLNANVIVRVKLQREYLDAEVVK